MLYKSAYVVDAIRSPIGKFAGALSLMRPDDLMAHLLKSLLRRNPKLNVNMVEDVIIGCTNQAGEDSRNIARNSLLLAGFPVTTGGITVNRLCASGLQSIIDSSRAIQCSDGDIYIAGGVESMSRSPYIMSKSETAFGRNNVLVDSTIGTRFPNILLNELYHPYTLGETAENIASRWKISRLEQDKYAYQSQKKYWNAFQQGYFNEEIVSVFAAVKGNKKNVVEFSVDEHPREVSIEQLGRLSPAFQINGTVTAGNSSGLNDGAACCVVASEELVNRHQLEPLARIVSRAVVGVDPSIMGIGPVEASRLALKRAKLSVSDVGLWEINEAFASQSIACIHELGVDPCIVNIQGGAIALGHPLGCSGARIVSTLLHAMKRNQVRYGVATMCVGMGQGVAVVFERM